MMMRIHHSTLRRRKRKTSNHNIAANKDSTVASWLKQVESYCQTTDTHFGAAVEVPFEAHFAVAAAACQSHDQCEYARRASSADEPLVASPTLVSLRSRLQVNASSDACCKHEPETPPHTQERSYSSREFVDAGKLSRSKSARYSPTAADDANKRRDTVGVTTLTLDSNTADSSAVTPSVALRNAHFGGSQNNLQDAAAANNSISHNNDATSQRGKQSCYAMTDLSKQLSSLSTLDAKEKHRPATLGSGTNSAEASDQRELVESALR